MPKIDLSNEATRAYVYRVALAVLVLLAAYKAIDGQLLEQWTDIVRAVLGIAPITLAVANTKTKS